MTTTTSKRVHLPWLGHGDAKMLAALPPESRREMSNLLHHQARENQRWKQRVVPEGELETLGDLYATRLDARKRVYEFGDDGPVGEPRKAISRYWSPAGDDTREFLDEVRGDAVATLLMDRVTARGQGRERWAKWLISRAVITALPERRRSKVEALVASARRARADLPPDKSPSVAAIARRAGVSETSAQRWLIETVLKVEEAIAMTVVDLLEWGDPLELDSLPDDFLEPVPYPWGEALENLRDAA